MMGPLVVLVTLVAAGVSAVPAPQAELIENLRLRLALSGVAGLWLSQS
jgi:hypothetical protein